MTTKKGRGGDTLNTFSETPKRMSSVLRQVPKAEAVITFEGVEYSTITQELVAMKVASKLGLAPNKVRWSDSHIYFWIKENAEELGTFIAIGNPGSAHYFPKKKLQKLIRRYLKEVAVKKGK